MIYLDSCALVKLVAEEAESAALQAWLDDRPEQMVVTSGLAAAEVVRVIRRNNHTDKGLLIDADELSADLAEAELVLADVAQITITADVLATAGRIENPMIRTLDAIHLASALKIVEEIAEFVTYDRRLMANAKESGFSVVAPS